MPVTAKIPDPTEGAAIHPDLAAGGVGHNGPPGMTQDMFLFYLGQIAKAAAAKKEAALALKKIRSRAEVDGVRLMVLDRAVKEMDQDPETTRSELETLQQYCGFMGLPITWQVVPVGTQGSLFGDGSQEVLLTRAFEEGRGLGLMGKNPDEQKYLPISPEGQEHMRGWNEGQDVLLSKLKTLDEPLPEKPKKAKKAKETKAAKPETDEAGAGEGTEPAAGATIN